MTSLDVVGEMVFRFGPAMALHYQPLASALLPLVEHARPATRKRAATALGSLSRHIPDKLFTTVGEEVIANLIKCTKAEVQRSYLVCITNMTYDENYFLANR